MTDIERPTFATWLGKHRRGALEEEVTAALGEVVTAVAAHNKPGHLSLRIDVTPSGRTVLITDRVTTKIPEPDREAAIYFPGPEGGLHRDDPYQGLLFDRATGELAGAPDPEED